MFKRYYMLQNEGTGGTGGGAEFTIPEAYKGEASLQGIKSQDDLFKGFVNAQKMIGGRVQPPKDTDPPEAWEKFYNTLGRPESPDKYEFEDVKIEGLNKDPESEKAIRTILHKAGLTAKQAKLLQSEYDKLIGEQYQAQSKKQLEEKAKADEHWNNTVKELFGDKKDQALKTTKQMITEYSNPKLKDAIDKMDDNQLLVMASVLNSVHDKFIKPDGKPGAGANATTTTREAIMEKMKSAAYNDKTHKEHDQTVAEVQAFYASLK